MSTQQVINLIKKYNDKNFVAPGITPFGLGRKAFKSGVVPPKKCHPEIIAGWRSCKHG